METAEHELRTQHRWTRGATDLFSIARMGRKETVHCRVLAWLMDPIAPHGMGPNFLRGILKATLERLPLVDQLDQVRPRCEVVRADSRADIVLFHPDFTVVFEAKIDADEGSSQCARIYQDFADDPDPRFVFLTVDRRPPQTAPEGVTNLFRPLSFRDVQRELRESLGSGLADARGRPAAVEYLRALETEFG